MFGIFKEKKHMNTAFLSDLNYFRTEAVNFYNAKCCLQLHLYEMASKLAKRTLETL